MKNRVLASYLGLAIGDALGATTEFMLPREIHADGILKNPLNYEPFSPEEVGLSRSLVIGKHTGSHLVRERFNELGICLTGKEASEILQTIRRISARKKGPLEDAELVKIYDICFSEYAAGEDDV